MKFEIRRLDVSCIPNMLAIQEEVIAALPDPDILRRNTFDTLEVCFHSPSLVLGAIYNDAIVGFGILYIAGDDKENLAYSLDTHGDLSEYGNVKLVIVKDEFRGNGLQRIFVARFEEYAKRIGIKYLLSTVSPVNSYSSKNLELSGFKVIKRLKKYGNKDRLLYYKDISEN